MKAKFQFQKIPPQSNHLTPLVQKTLNSFCKLIGHNWRYKDYSNWMKDNGDKYEFKASRNCFLCNQTEYLYNEWQIAKQKSPLDVEVDSYSMKQLPELETH